MTNAIVLIGSGVAIGATVVLMQVWAERHHQRRMTEIRRNRCDRA